MMRFPVSAVCVALLVASCGDDSTSESKEPLQIPRMADPSKSDAVGDEVHQNGRLSLGGEVFGEFVEDGQLEGYFFTAEAGSVVTIDNTNRGTTRILDTTLFVFGPADDAGYYGVEPVGVDDDSGWGAHAKIAGLAIPSRGDYLVVLGTSQNTGRGRYRLELACQGGSCAVPCGASCGDEDPCSGYACDSRDGCISAAVPLQCTEPAVDKRVSVSKTEVATSEAGETDSFVVQLGAVPADHVTIWVASSDPDQAVVYPQKLNFCKPGYEEQANGCKAATSMPEVQQEHWTRAVEVKVTGVRSSRADGDVPYAISLRVESADADYAAIALEPLTGHNLGDLAAPDLAELDTIQDSELLGALHDLVKGHTAYGYLGQNSARTVMFSAVDLRDGKVASLYDGSTVVVRPLDATEAYKQGFNTEHTWPQGQFDQLEPAKSDLHHIFPTDIQCNSDRASYDFGMTRKVSDESLVGSPATGNQIRVYQVRPERRGDVARAHFYMVARYRGDGDLGIEFDDDNDAANGSVNDLEEETLRMWNREDPVDDLERSRNNRIEAYQGKRNPFVDRPDLVDRVANF
jgi:endonuclease I